MKIFLFFLLLAVVFAWKAHQVGWFNNMSWPDWLRRSPGTPATPRHWPSWATKILLAILAAGLIWFFWGDIKSLLKPDSAGKNPTEKNEIQVSVTDGDVLFQPQGGRIYISPPVGTRKGWYDQPDLMWEAGKLPTGEYTITQVEKSATGVCVTQAGEKTCYNFPKN